MEGPQKPVSYRGPIISFSGPHQFLGGDHPARVLYEDVEYPSLTHAYQASKSISPQERLWIRNSPTPAEARRRGQRFLSYRRGDWDQSTQVQVLRELVAAKFSNHNISLRRALVLTRDAELAGQPNGKVSLLGALMMRRRAELSQDLRVLICGPRPPRHMRQGLADVWMRENYSWVSDSVVSFEQSYGVRVGLVVSRCLSGFDQIGEQWSRKHLRREPECYPGDNAVELVEGVVALWNRISQRTREIIQRAQEGQLYLQIRYLGRMCTDDEEG